MISEELLVKQSRQGDLKAFEELVLLYQDKIYALAYRYLGNEEDANDLAQEAFIKAFRSLSSFKGESGFGTWLFRIASNLCLDELRGRKRRIKCLSLDEPVITSQGEELPKEIPDLSAAVDDKYEKKELSLYIQKLLNELKPDYKAIIVLRDMMGFSYEEIAEILKCSQGTVKSRLNRARAILRKKLLKRELLP
ncbi:MAG: RNA polymerase sigma factor [Syntrophomonadaceae bacterium]|jgi:RNA polymerase sigma-70 factor (ECF subfamily)